MKTGMCKGCSNLHNRIQIIHYDENGHNIEPPLKIMKPFCTQHQLHMESVEQIIKGNKECPRYYER